MSQSLLLQPRISEKSFTQAQDNNVYTFDVPTSANKVQIAEAVESQYKVSVTNVRVSVVKGKRKNTPVKRSQPIVGQRNKTKKAYVTLKTGDRIAIFEEAA